MDLRLNAHPLVIRACGVLALAAVMLLAGCVGTDFVESAEGALTRAFRFETPSAFFRPVIERARGDPVQAHMHVRARQHYLQVIASIERLTPSTREELRQAGLLGEAYVLKSLAQWRLGRLDDARQSIDVARASNQEALRARDRALFDGLIGVLQLEKAIEANETGRPFREVFQLTFGDQGAWRALGIARTKIGSTDPMQTELMQCRLGAYAQLVAARRRDPSGADELDPETLSRLRAEAQVELNELARSRSADAASFAANVRRWQVVCGLDAPIH